MKRINLSLFLVAYLAVMNILSGCTEDINLETELGFKPVEIPTTPDISLNDKESAIHSELDAFGIRTLKNILEKDSENNIALSPFSALAAASLYENTLIHSYGQHLNLSALIDYEDIDDVNSTIKNLTRFLPDKSHGCDVNVGNSLWLNKNTYLPDTLKNIAKVKYFAEVFQYEIGDYQWLEDTSCKWVKYKTNGKVSDFKLSSDDTRAITVNVIYFKGEWETKFDPKQTGKRTFQGFNKDISAEFMNGELEKVPYIEDEKWSAIALPFHGNYEMIFVLPAEGVSLADAADALSIQKRAKFTNEYIGIHLPKFKIEQNRYLNSYFREPLDASIKQFTSVEVNEDGAEAIAITTVFDGAPSKHIVFDRPFLFSIVNRVSGTSLMMGAVMNPAAGK